jgi:NAD(P)H-quinone oxidoreductase subunit 5
MEPIVGYSSGKSQNMAFIGGLKKHMPITRTTFLLGTLSFCGISFFASFLCILLLACFWSKHEILANSCVYFPVIGWIAWIMARLIVFYMFNIYFITLEGNFKANSFKKIFFCFGGNNIQKVG